jgi:tRNA A37 threonylcarbamoyladenosine biosynthesis protein TsaE
MTYFVLKDAGTGKTTVISTIVNNLEIKKYVLLAPTLEQLR